MVVLVVSAEAAASLSRLVHLLGGCWFHAGCKCDWPDSAMFYRYCQDIVPRHDIKCIHVGIKSTSFKSSRHNSTMVDSKPKSIPQWQRQDPIKDSEKPQGDKSENVPNATQSPTSTRATLVDQASKFLENEEIRDSSTGRKIEYLESKGLTNEEIHNLLGVSKNIEATTTPPPPTLPDATVERVHNLEK